MKGESMGPSGSHKSEKKEVVTGRRIDFMDCVALFLHTVFVVVIYQNLDWWVTLVALFYSLWLKNTLIAKVLGYQAL